VRQDSQNRTEIGCKWRIPGEGVAEVLPHVGEGVVKVATIEDLRVLVEHAYPSVSGCVYAADRPCLLDVACIMGPGPRTKEGTRKLRLVKAGPSPHCQRPCPTIGLHLSLKVKRVLTRRYRSSCSERSSVTGSWPRRWGTSSCDSKRAKVPEESEWRVASGEWRVALDHAGGMTLVGRRD
jgi:hypothetical protein